MRGLVLGAFTLSLLFVAMPAANACSRKSLFAGPANPVVLPAEELPPQLQLSHVVTLRGRGPCTDANGFAGVSSCDDLGALVVSVKTPNADVPPCRFGFRLRVVGGALPEGLSLLDEPAAAECGPAGAPDTAALFFSWLDGRTDAQDAFAFDLQVTARDGAGRDGPPAVIRLAHSGEQDAADRCSVTAPATSPPADTSAGGCGFVGPRGRSVGRAWLLFSALALGLLKRVVGRAHSPSGHGRVFPGRGKKRSCTCARASS